MAFPTFWQTLLPNVNTFTAIGIIIIVLSVLLLLFGGSLWAKYSLGGFMLGLGMIYIPSIMEDLLTSREGIALVLGVIMFVLVLYYVGFRPKKSYVPKFRKTPNIDINVILGKLRKK